MKRTGIFLSLALMAVAAVTLADRKEIFTRHDAQELKLVEQSDTSKSIGLAKDFFKDANRIITFGFELRSSPEEDARQYIPFLKYLEKSTGYYFKLHFAREDGQLADDLGKGVVQLAAVGAVSFLKAHQIYDVIPLVRGLNKDGKAAYQSVIVTAPDSPINSIKDLVGKTFAFAGIDSMQGHFIPRIALETAGIKLSDLAAYDYTGSHRNCADAVISGKFDACGMQDTMGRAQAREGRVKIIYTSEFFPSSGIAVNKGLPAEVVENIRQALIDFDPKGRHSQGLHNWEGTEMPNGFEVATLENYTNFLTQMNRLGLLN